MKQTNLKQQSFFSEKVKDIVKSIPKGKTMSYGEVALKAGESRAARAVGMVMAKNKDKTVPCHRVIKSDGTIGGYNGIRGDKEKLLRMEGAILY
jgi:methylated-DNA-[protein]-cysteine S-methyltransferase